MKYGRYFYIITLFYDNRCAISWIEKEPSKVRTCIFPCNKLKKKSATFSGIISQSSPFASTPEMENTGIIEMNTYSDEQESQLFEGDEKVLVHCYSVVGKVLAADLVNVDK